MPGCAAYNCSNQSSKGYRLFRFPAASDAECRKKWIINCRRYKWEPSQHSKICEEHFEDSQYEKNREDGWKKLKPNAIPTIFYVKNPPPRIEPQQRKSLYKRKAPTDIAVQNYSSQQTTQIDSNVSSLGTSKRKMMASVVIFFIILNSIPKMAY